MQLTIASLGNSTLSRTSIQLFSHIMAPATIILNNSSKQPKRSSARTLKLCLLLSTTSALKCKELGHSVKNCNIQEWNKKAKELCFPGILCKFQQNSGLAAFLKNTGDKTLLECCYENIWGNGIPLSSPDYIINSKYKHQGIQGEILGEIHAILCSTIPYHVESIPCGNDQETVTTLHVVTAPTQHDLKPRNRHV